MPDECSKLLDEITPSLDDVLDNSPAGDFFMDCEDIERDYERLCKRKGVDPRDENPDLREIAEKKAKDRAKKAYDEAVSEIHWLFYQNERIDVYREIYVDDVPEFIDSLSKHGRSMYRGEMRGVGYYWAWDIGHAFSYGHSGGKGPPIVLVSTIGCDDIDLEMTIGDYMMFTSKESGILGGENEVNLLEGRKIVIDQILTRDGKNLIEGRTIEAWT
jgi:hypothetical protein